MKRNQYFDHNHSKKKRFPAATTWTPTGEAQFNDGTIVNFALL